MEGKEIFKRGWHPSTELLVSALVTDVLMRHLLIMGLSFTLNRDEQLGAPASDTGPREDGAERPRAEGWGWGPPPGAMGQNPPPNLSWCWVNPACFGVLGSQPGKGGVWWKPRLGRGDPFETTRVFFFFGGGAPLLSPPPHGPSLPSPSAPENRGRNLSPPRPRGHHQKIWGPGWGMGWGGGV